MLDEKYGTLNIIYKMLRMAKILNNFILKIFIRFKIYIKNFEDLLILSFLKRVRERSFAHVSDR